MNPLYAADLAVWLWTILLRGQSCRAYNVGSEADRRVQQVAEQVAAVCLPLGAVRRACDPQSGRPATRYVPSTARARIELGLAQWIDLPAAIHKTMAAVSSER